MDATMNEQRSGTGTIDQVELRYCAGLEVRAAAEGDTGTVGTILGYAAVFNSESRDLGGFKEVIAPGAFKRSLDSGADVRALVRHDSSLILGRRSVGTLKVEEDAKGLRVDIKVPDTQAGRDILTSIKRGDITGMSFGFRTMDDSWAEQKDGTLLRTLKDAEIREVSVVSFPAYEATTVEARSLFERLAQDGRKKLGKDAQPPSKPTEPAKFPRRDRIIRKWNIRKALLA